MHNVEEMTARSLISRLRGIAEGMNGWYGIAWRQRQEALDAMLTAADATISIDRGRQVVTTRGGDRLDVKDVEYDGGVIERVGASARAWLTNNGQVGSELLRGITVPRDLDRIAERMGTSATALIGMASAIHRVGICHNDASLSVHSGHDGITATYVNGRLSWRNGRIVIINEVIPETIRRGLANVPISRLVDDAVIGDIVIRTVGHVDTRERRIRAIAYGTC